MQLQSSQHQLKLSPLPLTLTVAFVSAAPSTAVVVLIVLLLVVALPFDACTELEVSSSRTGTLPSRSSSDGNGNSTHSLSKRQTCAPANTYHFLRCFKCFKSQLITSSREVSSKVKSKLSTVCRLSLSSFELSAVILNLKSQVILSLINNVSGQLSQSGVSLGHPVSSGACGLLQLPQTHSWAIPAEGFGSILARGLPQVFLLWLPSGRSRLDALYQGQSDLVQARLPQVGVYFAFTPRYAQFGAN